MFMVLSAVLWKFFQMLMVAAVCACVVSVGVAGTAIYHKHKQRADWQPGGEQSRGGAYNDYAEVVPQGQSMTMEMPHPNAAPRRFLRNYGLIDEEEEEEDDEEEEEEEEAEEVIYFHPHQATNVEAVSRGGATLMYDPSQIIHSDKYYH